jgi:hypothetical protein
VVLVLLAVWMLVLATGTPDGLEGLVSARARTLIAVGIVALVIEAIRRLVRRNRAP